MQKNVSEQLIKATSSGIIYVHNFTHDKGKKMAPKGTMAQPWRHVHLTKWGSGTHHNQVKKRRRQ